MKQRLKNKQTFLTMSADTDFSHFLKMTYWHNINAGFRDTAVNSCNQYAFLKFKVKVQLNPEVHTGPSQPHLKAQPVLCSCERPSVPSTEGQAREEIETSEQGEKKCSLRKCQPLTVSAKQLSLRGKEL